MDTGEIPEFDPAGHIPLEVANVECYRLTPAQQEHLKQCGQCNEWWEMRKAASTSTVGED
jgi:hypothetical protein